MKKCLAILLLAVHLAVTTRAEDAPMKGIALVYTAPFPTPESIQAAIAAEAHVIAFQSLPATPETLSAALAAAKNKLYVDLPITQETTTKILETVSAAEAMDQTILSSTDLQLLKQIRKEYSDLRLRLCTGEAADAATLLPAILTLQPSQISHGVQRSCRRMGVAIWLDTSLPLPPGDAALNEAINWEVDYAAGLSFPRAVNRLREEGYYAARMLLCKLPVPPGTPLSLSGTRWKRGKHILVFKDPPLLIVKGGIIDRLFMNGISGEYTLSSDGTVHIRVKGHEGHGVFDGNYLATDGVECVRLKDN